MKIDGKDWRPIWCQDGSGQVQIIDQTRLPFAFEILDLNGEADAVLADDSFIQTAIQANSDLKVVGDPVALGGGVGMGIRESDGELRAKFDAAIQSMKDDGTLNELIAKWEVSSQW